MSLAKQFMLPLLIAAIASPLAAESEDLNTQLMRATVKLSHDKSTGTAFVLALAEDKKFVLVTAAHAFEKTPGDETSVIFRSRDAAGNYQKTPLKLVIRKAGKPAWTQHLTADVAVIGIVPPEGADLATVPVTLLASDESLEREHVHPGDLAACLGFPHRNEGSAAGFPILRTGAIATFPLLPTASTKKFFFSANTFEGDSGGPVYLTRPTHSEKPDARLILGLISAQQFLDEEAKMIYGTTKIRHRLGLAVVVHASLIRETIARLP